MSVAAVLVIILLLDDAALDRANRRHEVGAYIAQVCRRAYEAYANNLEDGPVTHGIDLVALLHGLLQQMTPLQREVLRDRIVGGLSARAISDTRRLRFSDVAHVIFRFFGKLRPH